MGQRQTARCSYGVFAWRENLQESRELIHDAKAENWSIGDVDADGDLPPRKIRYSTRQAPTKGPLPPNLWRRLK